MFLVCGEALFDFFLESEAGPAAATYAARAGGSPFNVAIGLARLGQASGLLTGLSTDLLGQRLAQVLEDEGVSTAYAIPTDRPTTLSLVGLDTHGVPAYQFYDNGSADTGVTEADLPALGPEISGLHFGSYSLAAAPVADAFAALAAASRDRFISVDPNVRPTVEPDMDVWRERLAVLFPLADLVKISAEDLELLWPGRSSEALAARHDRPGREARGGDRRRRGGAGLDGVGASRDGGAAAGQGHRHRRRRRHVPGGAARAAAARRRPEGGAGGAGRGRARGDPRLCRARGGHHLLAARARTCRAPRN